MKPEEYTSASITSRLRPGLTLIIVIIVISSPIIVLVNPTLIAAPLSKDGGSVDAAPSTIGQEGDFTAQAPLQIPRTLQSNDLVNSLAFYEVTFITSTTGAIDKIRMDFPAGTNIAAAGVIERVGIGGGTLLKSGSSITYDLTTPVSVPAGTFIRLEISGVKNPIFPSNTLTAAITTKDSGGTTIDGPSATNVYNIRQIGGGDIASGSIHSGHPRQDFMERRTLTDSEFGGHNFGWNPDGFQTIFTISEPVIITIDISYVNVVVQDMGGFPTGTDCQASVQSPTTFNMICDSAPAEGTILNYMVINLPGHIT